MRVWAAGWWGSTPCCPTTHSRRGDRRGGAFRSSPAIRACGARWKYAYGDSRIDILLEDPRRPPCWVEVKNCHLLRQPGLAEFPDCRTERGVKHLKALERMAAEGHRAVMLFVIQRMDTDRFDTADDIDKAYGPALREAATRGVEVLCYGCHLSPEAIRLDRRVPWRGAETQET